MDTVPVPLGNDLTLNLPFSADLAADGLDLDEDQLYKLNLLRKTQLSFSRLFTLNSVVSFFILCLIREFLHS